MGMGLIAAFISAVFSTSKDIVSKKLSFDVDGTTSAFASFFFALPYYLFLLCILYLLGVEDFHLGSQFFIFVLLRALSDTGAEWCKMHAFSHADISLVSCFMAAYPLLLLITSPLITGDPIPPAGIFAVLMVVLGSLILIYKPQSDLKAQKKGIIFALLAALFFSLNSCFDRLAVQKASPTMSGFAMTLLSGLFLAPLVLRKGERVTMLVQYRHGFLVRGFFEIGFMVLKLCALMVMQAPYVVGIQKVSLLLSIISGKFVFKEGDFKRRLLAGLFILVGIVVILMTLGRK